METPVSERRPYIPQRPGVNVPGAKDLRQVSVVDGKSTQWDFPDVAWVTGKGEMVKSDIGGQDSTDFVLMSVDRV